MTLITAFDLLVGSGTTGATTLLTGNSGGLIIFAIAVTIVLMLVGAFYALKRKG